MALKAEKDPGSSSPGGVIRGMPWAWSMTLALFVAGLLAATYVGHAVLALGELIWHPARDAELRATYQSFVETGVPLIKQAGTGSYYTWIAGATGYEAAAWDDDPGSYLAASYAGALTGSESPYPGLGLIQMLLVAVPFLWLPITMARMFLSPTAGFAVASLPLVMHWVNGTPLVGTEYGLSSTTSPTPVYALYGLAASTLFLTLSLLLLFSTSRHPWWRLVLITLLVGTLGGVGNLMRSLSGVGAAAAVGVIWWLSRKGRPFRISIAVLASGFAVVMTFMVQSAVMDSVNRQRVEAIGGDLASVPTSHATWSAPYLGLGYTGPQGTDPPMFDVVWSDEFSWQKAREIDPDAVISSPELDHIMRDLYFGEVRAQPAKAVHLAGRKLADTLGQMKGLCVLNVLGLAVMLATPGLTRSRSATALAITSPSLLLALLPPVVVYPLLYYFTELSAVLGLLGAVVVGGLASLAARLVPGIPRRVSPAK